MHCNDERTLRYNNKINVIIKNNIQLPHKNRNKEITLLSCHNKNPLQINAYKYYFYPHSMNIWNRLPCSAVSDVMIPSVDNFHKFAIPAIRVNYGAALI